MNRNPGQQRPAAQPQYRQNPQQTSTQTVPGAAGYPPYGMPPRNVLGTPGYLPQRVPLGTPFMQPRATNGANNGGASGAFPFGLSHTGLPPHLQQQQQPPQHAIGGSTDAALDLNDFPALGAPSSTSSVNGANGSNSTGTPQITSSYASAGSAPQPTHVAPSRDLTQDDFPALGENTTSTSNATAVAANGTGGPPGLFGNAGGAATIPGMLNLSGINLMGARHTGSFDEKRHTNPPNPAPLNAVSTPFLQVKSSANTPAASSQNISSNALNTPAWSHAPAPSSTSSIATITPLNPTATQGFPESGSSNAGIPAVSAHSSTGTAALLQSQAQAGAATPPTPAHQVLVSAADRWGLLGLLAMIRESSDADFDVSSGTRRTGDSRVRLSSIGTDLGSMGLDMNFQGNLYSSFITPWADQNAVHAVEPDFHLPACYAAVHAPPPGPSKASAFSDETLFFMFYSSARDALQEVAAQELWNRNWRYHKELRVWITKESGTAPSTKVPGGEQGLYTIWDADNWVKEHKEMSVLYADLEEKNVPAFAAGATLVPVGQAAPPSSQTQQQRGFGITM